MLAPSSTRSSTRRHRIVALLALALVALDCAGQTDTQVPAVRDPSPLEPVPPDTGGDAADSTPEMCEPGAAAFTTYAWIPDDASSVVRVARTAPDSDAAFERLQHFLNRSDLGATTALPIVLKFELGLLGLVSDLVSAQLAQIGVPSAHLLSVRRSDGTSTWVSPHACDVEELARRIRDAWNIQLRVDSTARLGRAPVADGFPYDVVLGPASRLHLPPAGHGRAIFQWLASPSPAMTRRARTAPRFWFGDDPVIAQLHPSPPIITIEWRGHHLSSSADETQHTANPSAPLHRRIDVWAHALAIDGIVWPSP